MDRKQLEHFRDVAVRAAEAAAGVAHQAFIEQSSKQTQRQWKEDGQLNMVMTQSDLDAETAARAVITQAFPDHEILGEEFGLTSSGSEYRWLIDPIDGSRNFSYGVPIYACGAALLHRDEPIAGCIVLPQEEVVLTAARDLGAELNGQPIQLPNPPELGKVIIAYNWKNREAASADVFMPARDRLERVIGTTRSYGSALANVTYLLMGRVHVVLSAHTTPWDMVPGAFFAREAGGVAVAYDGKPWTIGTVGMITAHELLAIQLVTKIGA